VAAPLRASYLQLPDSILNWLFLLPLQRCRVPRHSRLPRESKTLEPGVFRVVLLLVREAAADAGGRAAVQEAQADLPLLVLQCNAEPAKSRKRGDAVML